LAGVDDARRDVVLFFHGRISQSQIALLL